MIDLPGKSKMTIGGYDLENLAMPGAALKFHQVPKNFTSWDIKLDSMTIRGQEDNKNLTVGQGANVTIDSGTSYIVLPKPDLQKIADYWASLGLFTKDCSEQGVMTCPCSDQEFEKVPDLIFTFDGQKYLFPKEAQFFRSKGHCGLKMTSLEGGGFHNTWILGLTFF